MSEQSCSSSLFVLELDSRHISHVLGKPAAHFIEHSSSAASQSCYLAISGHMAANNEYTGGRCSVRSIMNTTLKVWCDACDETCLRCAEGIQERYPVLALERGWWRSTPREVPWCSRPPARRNTNSNYRLRYLVTSSCFFVSLSFARKAVPSAPWNLKSCLTTKKKVTRDNFAAQRIRTFGEIVHIVIQGLIELQVPRNNPVSIKVKTDMRLE